MKCNDYLEREYIDVRFVNGSANRHKNIFMDEDIVYSPYKISGNRGYKRAAESI